MHAERRSLTLRYFALLREQTGLEHEQITTTAATPRELYEDLANRHAFTLPSNRIGVAVNNEFRTLDHFLNDGDQVVFIPPVAGG
jgi:molybdopterin converting factor subunit 1